MANKTFKIGEYALGGIIKVSVDGTKVSVQALDWNTKQVVKQRTFLGESLNKIGLWIECELTTSYYAGKILDWIITL